MTRADIESQLQDAACLSCFGVAGFEDLVEISSWEAINSGTPIPPGPPDNPTDPALPSFDDFESYSVGASLSGLNGGVNWPSAWQLSGDTFDNYSSESFESYSAGTNLNGQNAGTGDWNGAWQVQN